MLAPPFGRRPALRRILYYSHDSYGLGHLTRTLALAGHVRERLPETTQLIVSGASHTEGWSLPAGADWIKLPSVVKVGAGDYRPRTLACTFDTARRLRQEIVLAAARWFRPDLLVVDHIPGGLEGEALPALRHVAASGGRLVLGLRDVLDDARLVHRAWRRGGVHALLDRLYDRIVVYGDRDVYDVVERYGFSPVAAAKTRYLGYLRAPDPAPVEAVRRRLGVRGRQLVVVTAGGGGDGFSLIAAAIDVLSTVPRDVDAFVVTGPLMAEDERADLARRAGRCGGNVRLVSSVTRLSDVLAAADAVVSMGGYNTVREILTYRRPALIVPRVRPRLEQLVRAEALAGRGLVRLLHPAELTPRRLREELARLLDAPQRAGPSPTLDGLDAFVTTIRELVAPAVLEEAAVGA